MEAVEETLSCPICEKEIFSDIKAEKSCALCGMIIPKEVVTKSIKNYFCCDICFNFHKDFIIN
jgi:hypothetical protein